MDSGDTTNDQELLDYNRKLKKAVLDVLFTQCDTFYVHCMPNARLQIGKRGLVDKEKTEGIILVFGPYSTRQLDWDETGIQCEMQFGRWERVVIPFECIGRTFDKSGQVLMQWATIEAPEAEGKLETLPIKPEEAATEGKAGKEAKDESPGESRVIEVDFTNKKKQ